MSDWAVFWLATIAVAVVVMTLLQIAVLVQAARLARDASDTVRQLRKDVAPLIEQAQRIADDAGRAVALARAQVERVDEIVATSTERIDDVLDVVQRAIVGPARQGTAVWAAVRAALAFFRSRQERSPGGRDEDHALFIG